MSEEFREPKVVDAKLVVDPEIRNWAMLCHLSSLIGFIIPFGSVIAPLIVWQMKKGLSPFIDDQGKESVNFQLTMMIAIVISYLLVLILVGFILLGIIAIVEIILVVMAVVQVNEGKLYRYPIAIRFIR